jgi:transcriptional regulator with XRE-family HTH domain
MGLRVKPSQRQKRLGQELRRLRELAGLSGTEAGALVGLGRAHMSHVEAGRTHISPEKISALLASYGCTDAQLIDVLTGMSRVTGHGWWTKHRGFQGTRIRELAELEASASRHRSFQWLHVPGLLQTPDYMRTLFSRSQPTASAATIEEQVEFRLARQQVIFDEPLPRYHAVIHETTFHMHFVSPQTMRGQLAYLLEASRFPNITIQLLPFSATAHPATPGAPFTLLDTGPLRTVYVEHPISSMFLGDEPHIEQFCADFTKLADAALSPLDADGPMGAGSLGLVQHLLYVLREDAHVGP